MKKFHVNSKGEPRPCSAQIQCPYGGVEDHYESKKDAQAAFEASMHSSFGTTSVSKREMLGSEKLDRLVEAHGSPSRGIGAGTMKDPIHVKGDTLLAARLISEGKHVRLNKTHEVGTLLTELRAIVLECERLGEQAPVFDLCKVSVPKTNLFCASTKGIPRAKMPQLTGFAEAGSPAASLPVAKNGKVNVAEDFKRELKGYGIKTKTGTVRASALKASQAELDGPKVARKVAKARAGKLEDKVIFVTKDGYIIDGHHQWATKVALGTEKGKDLKMKVEMVDMEIGEAIDFANAFAQKMGIQAKTVGAAA